MTAAQWFFLPHTSPLRCRLIYPCRSSIPIVRVNSAEPHWLIGTFVWVFKSSFIVGSSGRGDHQCPVKGVCRSIRLSKARCRPHSAEVLVPEGEEFFCATKMQPRVYYFRSGGQSPNCRLASAYLMRFCLHHFDLILAL